MDLVRVASGASALRMPIAYTLELLVSSRDGFVFSVLPRTSYYAGISSTDTLFPHLLVFGWSTAVVRLVSQFLSVCLVVSRGWTTGSNDDVQPRIVHSDCGVTIKVTSFAPI